VLHIDEILKLMVERDASDLYIRAGCPPMLRVDGETRPAPIPKLMPDDTLTLAQQIMSLREQAIFEEGRQVDLSYGARGVGRFRANIYTQRGTTGMVFRRIKTEVPTIELLGLPDVLKTLSMEKRGLFLVTGATGSGKSTTLAAMIDWRNANSTGHIVTIEDPIEFMHPDKGCIISQREVGLDVPNFADALRAALRQAPDVLLVGEIRDLETVSASLTFAETGHYVLSTLHSINANQTLERILQFYPSSRHEEVCSHLSLNLRGIISQRLIPSINGGRVAALEIMVATPRIKELLKRGQITDLKTAIAAGDREGMQTFDQALYKLWDEGRITQEDALRYADSANDLRLRMRGFGNLG
jgi:twitching motility protein PilU